MFLSSKRYIVLTLFIDSKMDKFNVWKSVHTSNYILRCLIMSITFVVRCPQNKVTNGHFGVT